ncbi:MAG: hypothetical protein M3O28_12330, partial [Actinomycetota bacterium]|nr:hypothetical protein [Actinomycetota bacterium]
MYTTLPVTVSRAGCYTFTERLTLAEGTQSALDTTAGVPAETVLITGAGSAGVITPPARPGSPAPRPSVPATVTLAQTGPRAPILSALLIGSGLVCLGTVLATTPRRRPT